MIDALRRYDLVRLSQAERAIREAVIEVEKMPADGRLTDAVILLNAAMDSVADYIDGVGTRRSVKAV